jgi:hypothetical protein
VSDRLFDVDEEYPEVPILRPPRRRSEGDARFRGEYPPEWETCRPCGGLGRVTGKFAQPFVESGLWEAQSEVEPGIVRCGACLGMGSLKARVRLEAGFRCLRCRHPYLPKADAKMLSAIVPTPELGTIDGPPKPSWRPGGWSACDGRCDHAGPMRVVDERGVLKVAHENPPPDWHRHILGSSGRRTWSSGWRRESEWRILTVHHADGDKANVRWWNLLALCQRCHLEVQGKIVMERVWPHPHSPWFRPFVAGYYAWAYLGEELTREQAKARLDELLALELDPAYA